MSRGPGRWQRAILERLQTREQFYLWEILPSPPNERGGQRPHVQMAVLRAAHRTDGGLFPLERNAYG
jgi:hypothetical protein